jgi:hypothetical protein
MSKLRFRYALEPVLLTRRWALDALMLSLADHNADIAAHAAVQATTRENYVAASAEWQAEQMESVQPFAIRVRYLSELSRQLREQAERMTVLVEARDAVIEQVVRAQRAVEMAEQHRDEMKDQFIQQRLSADFKLADDQWNTLQTGADNHDN